QVNAAVENVYTVLRARIDQFGVVQPNIQRLDNSGRILVELPGVKDPDRVKKLLQATAELEFWNVYNGSELIGFLNAANETLKTIVENPRAKKDSLSGNAVSEEELADDLNITAVDDQTDNIALKDTGIIDANETDGIDSLLVGTEADSLAADSAAATTFNPLYEVMFPNVNFQTGEPNPGPMVGYASVKDTGKVKEYLSNPKVKNLLTGNARYTKFLWTAKPDANGLLGIVAVQTDRNQKPILTGDVITDARQDFDERNSAIVSMNMNAQGAKKWSKITSEASSQDPKRSVAVVLDNYVYSAPTVQGEIPNGRTQIMGDFTVTEAQDLANILKAGALPAPARIIQADIVGPSLGQEAINAGLWSFGIALLIVMLYMIFYYSGAGIASDVALIVNMFFIFGVLASLGAVLTLPGIAGIVLTIGMAVDANVLIYERIREELLQGKGLKLAIKDGYSNAFSSIIDANVTTLLTGIILYLFGTGPIRGFATTLIIGILTSLFCAIFITRLIFEARLDRKKVVSFSTNITKGAFRNFNIDFLGKRKVAYLVSSLIIVAGIASLVTRGLNYGVDFVGGRSYQVRFDQPVSSVDIQTSLGDYFVNEDGTKVYPEVKTIGDDNQVVITTKYKISETGPEVEEDIKNRLYEGTQQYYNTVPDKEAFFSEAGAADIGIVAERQVGPTIADDIKKSAIWAILFSLVVIFLYILVRFSKWQFSLGAVAAAFHDVLVVLSLFSLLYGFLPFSLEIDQAFIAAVLTVIGYSLNDTVVVFDRIREYLGIKGKRKAMNVVVNEALNSTLSRTVNTSLTTFFVLLVIFAFGGEVIRGFMFALLIGIVVGTYSSLFIATPLMLDTLKKTDKEGDE
ncbi:MAG TPA: protein translocase subunit SecDF, partial [Cryomorphaceae bacterium]|nr:protein translocase subunit SecDF [Cryomorphaceae bacterium]